jgi:hypothetical protein
MAQIAKIIRKSEVAGVGCWIQFAGLMAPVVGYSLAGETGVKYGGALLLIFLVVGSVKSVRWICGNCTRSTAKLSPAALHAGVSCSSLRAAS